MPEVDGLALVPITLEHGLLGLLEVITEPVYHAFVASITPSSRAHADAHRPELGNLGMLIEALACSYEGAGTRLADCDRIARSDEDVELPDLDLRFGLVVAHRLDDQERALAVVL